MRLALSVLLISAAFGPLALTAAQYNGSVRAADAFVPGATVTARQGDKKVTAFTDENGRYAMDLAPGVWDIQVEMFGFTPEKVQVAIGEAAVTRDWVLSMPKIAGGTSAASLTPIPGAATASGRAGFGVRGGRGGFGGPGGRGGLGGYGGRGGQTPQGGRGGAAGQAAQAQPQPSFQSATVRPTLEGQQAAPNADTQAAPDAAPAADFGSEADDAFLVNGSTSGGLAQSGDDEARRQQMMAGRGGPGGPGGGGGAVSAALGLQNAAGLPPGMSASLTNDSLGLGGFGADAINGGFGVGAAGAGPGGPGGAGGGFGGRGAGAGGGFGGPGGGGPGGGGAGGGGGGGRGGGGGGRGGGGGGRGAGGRGGPFNGQFASFGNRRRNTNPPLTGSVAITATNSYLNAAPFSLNGQASQKPYSATNRLNANVGGPLVIPKIVNWPRAQFTVSVATGINRNGRDLLGSVPTPAELGGDFSQIANVIYDPTNGAPFPNNRILPTSFNSASKGLLQYFPGPLYTGIVQNYRFVITDPSDSHSVGVRFNAPLNNKDRLNFNVQTSGQSASSHQLFGFLDTSSGSGLSSSAGWSHSFAPRFNNNATVSLSRSISESSPYFAFKDNIAGQLGITGVSQDPLNYGPPSLSFTNFSGLSDGTPSLNRNQTLTFSDSITYVVRRKHNFTFGYTFNRLQQNSENFQNARGSFSFSGLLTSALDAKGQPVKGTGYDFADFLLGFPQTSSVRFSASNNYFRSWSTSAYVNDDFRAGAGLTINVGLRYEYFAPYTELRGHLANLDVNPGFTAVSVVTSGQNGPYSGNLPSSIVRPQPRDLSPRFGLAWRPSQKRSTIIRAGYGIFYSGSSYAQIAGRLAAQPPFATTATFTNVAAAPFSLQNAFSSAPASTLTNTYAIDPNFRIAYAQTWSFSIQNTLRGGFVLDTEYIGTKGTHLGIVENPNRSAGSVSTQQLQIANATSFTYQTDGANSIYNAAQARLTKFLSRSVSASVLYTFSKSIDDASSFSGTGGTVVQFLNNRGLERGLSTFDQRHNLSTTLQLSSPVGVRGFLRSGGWRATLLKSWNLRTTFTATTGTPLTAYVSGNLANTGGLAGAGNLRAEATGLPIAGIGGAYFNPLAFTTPPAGEFGDAGRDTIPGLFVTSLNASMNRTFRFGESRRNLAFTINASNVFNHVVVTSIGTTVNSSNYGLPTGASATRGVTLNMRFTF